MKVAGKTLEEKVWSSRYANEICKISLTQITWILRSSLLDCKSSSRRKVFDSVSQNLRIPKVNPSPQFTHESKSLTTPSNAFSTYVTVVILSLTLSCSLTRSHVHAQTHFNTEIYTNCNTHCFKSTPFYVNHSNVVSLRIHLDYEFARY